MTGLTKYKLGLACMLVLLTASVSAGERDPALAGFFAAPLVIASNEGAEHKFTVYLAATPNQRAHGLMFVRKLPADFGMLFIHPRPKVANMWMKNTILPLDMLFIRQDGTISSIARDTVPGSLETVSSKEEVSGVLELNAGTAERLNLAPGDKVIYHAFKSETGAAALPANGER